MLKSSVFVLACITLFSGCTESFTYVQSNHLIEKNASKYSNNKTTNNTPLSTPEEYRNNLNSEPALKVTPAVFMNQALMDFYNEWKDVKYKYGGNSKKGIDCSAFTQRIYKEKFDLNIPRTTLTQVKVGKHVKRSELEMGDLVFFKTGIRDRHVGIYMGDGSFMHASIKGVKFTKIDKPYYKRKYWTSRRVFD